MNAHFPEAILIGRVLFGGTFFAGCWLAIPLMSGEISQNFDASSALIIASGRCSTGPTSFLHLAARLVSRAAVGDFCRWKMRKTIEPTLPQVWGGVECTVNRVGDQYFDQLEMSGHAYRPEDLERFSRLGIAAFRQPLLWERAQARRASAYDWRWADDRINRLFALEISPILGLLHHGSGPRFTSLVDPDFPDLLADYAGDVAQRYPWVTDYTPVNEPLTTARFSGLYGHWYPHGRDDRTFMRALMNQCRAVNLCMQAVRTINPNARLIQTEDLGFVHSTRSMKSQANFENHRRWLTWDLLCGLVDDEHPLAQYMVESGASDAELEWFASNPCPPDILGINYYVTSERFLDDRIQAYPEAIIGTQARKYVDIEAVRILPKGMMGIANLIEQAWSRYHLPVALTEVSLACTCDEQIRWFNNAYGAARDAAAAGIDVRAVTAWALLGSYGWDRLVTSANGRYEPGALDVRTGYPRPTRLAAAIRRIAMGKSVRHPQFRSDGWWDRPERLLYDPTPTCNHVGEAS